MSNNIISLLEKLYKSVWLFPVLLAALMLALTCMQISGSSLGIMHELFYGTQDSALVVGTPRPIRSDEWLVNTQTVISQTKSGYSKINPYVGNSENMSLNPGIPYKDWSEAFRPQNLVFFVLPLTYAFAFQWWAIGYLLIVSCYFFVLVLLPRKRLLAASISLALFFSAFVQWWYEYGTLAPLYYSLFIATAVIYLTRQKQRVKKMLLCTVITYLLICFALVLYPPFQIACGLVLAAFLIGYLWETYPRLGRRNMILILGSLGLTAAISIAVVAVFLLTRYSVVQSMAHTSYPGQRASPSGDFNAIHLLASQLGYQFTSLSHTLQYKMHGVATNQSETSNFLLLSPLLIIPIFILMYKDWRSGRRADRLLVALSICFVIFMLHLFLPVFTPLSRLFLLNKVPTARLLIGMGLLNIFIVVSLIHRAERRPSSYWFSARLSSIYVIAVLILELCINIHIHLTTGTFVGIYRAVAFALPLPIIIYLVLRKRFVVAALLYFSFSLFISFKVNPLYRGLSIITNNPVSQAMVRISKGSDRRWVADSVITENLASANGLYSLSGVYYYPQNSLWNTIPHANYTDYNRYAHVTFGFFGDPTTTPQLKLVTQDQIRITTGICSPYLYRENVGFVLTSQRLTGDCITRTTPITLPAASYYIYQLRP